MQVLSAGHSGVLLDTQTLPAQLKAKRTGSVFLGRPNHAPGPGSLVAGWRLRLRCQQLVNQIENCYQFLREVLLLLHCLQHQLLLYNL